MPTPQKFQMEGIVTRRRAGAQLKRCDAAFDPLLAGMAHLLDIFEMLAYAVTLL